MKAPPPWDFIRDVEERTGAFNPRFVVHVLRVEDQDHMLADMIEGMVDRIEELETKLAALEKSKRGKK